MKYYKLMWVFLVFALTILNPIMGMDLKDGEGDCQAEFEYHNVSKFSVQFVNRSEGDVTNWLWDFGDGSTSAEENPIHQYTISGAFEVVLTIITSDECSSFVKKEIEIADGNHIYGEVMVGDNFLPEGKLFVYFSYHGGYYFELDTVVDIVSGGFDIPYNENVPYFLLAEPIFDLPEYYFPEYFPTYFGGSIFWENGSELLPEESEFVQIGLVRRDSIFYGNGSISGEVNDIHGSDLNGAVVYLLDLDYNPLKIYKLEEALSFEFFDIPYGDYYVVIEKIGMEVYDKFNYVEITETNPDEHIFIEVGGAVTAEKNDHSFVQCSVYPNPFVNKINLHFNNLFDQGFNVEVMNSLGQQLYSKRIATSTIDCSIDLSNVEDGFYFVKTPNETYKVLKLE